MSLCVSCGKVSWVSERFALICLEPYCPSKIGANLHTVAHLQVSGTWMYGGVLLKINCLQYCSKGLYGHMRYALHIKIWNYLYCCICKFRILQFFVFMTKCYIQWVVQGCESSDFLLFTKSHFQTFNALKSTSFRTFQIISNFFRLFLTDALIPLAVLNLKE